MDNAIAMLKSKSLPPDVESLAITYFQNYAKSYREPYTKDNLAEIIKAREEHRAVAGASSGKNGFLALVGTFMRAGVELPQDVRPAVLKALEATYMQYNQFEKSIDYFKKIDLFQPKIFPTSVEMRTHLSELKQENEPAESQELQDEPSQSQEGHFKP